MKVFLHLHHTMSYLSLTHTGVYCIRVILGSKTVAVNPLPSYTSKWLVFNMSGMIYITRNENICKEINNITKYSLKLTEFLNKCLLLCERTRFRESALRYFSTETLSGKVFKTCSNKVKSKRELKKETKSPWCKGAHADDKRATWWVSWGATNLSYLSCTSSGWSWWVHSWLRLQGRPSCGP